MNRFFTVITFLFISTVIYGQNLSGSKYAVSVLKAHGYPSYLEYDSLFYNSMGLVRYERKIGERSYYEYNVLGKITMKETYYDTNLFPVIVNRKLYEYNSFGNMTAQTEEAYNKSGKTLSKETDYIYDGQGRLIEETVISDYILMGYVDKLKTSTSYDESGNITQIAYKTELDSAWFPTEEISMSYDKDNRLIDSSVVLGWIDNYWNYQYTGEKTYDESGKLVLFREYSNWYGDGKLYPSDSTVYLYDNSGRLEETIKYNLRNKNSYTTRRISYNETGLVKSIETLNSSSGYMEGRKYNYEYIEDRWKTMTYEFYVDSIWKPGIKVEYGYDNAGNCTKAEVYYYIDSAWVFPYEEFDIEIPGLSRVVKAYMVEIEYTQINPIAVEHDIHAPATFSLAQNYPNPFNPETKISFSLPQSGKTMLKVYDMLGREVAELINGEMEKGPHSVSFNGRNLSSGVYIYRLQSGSFTESKKMMLLK